MAFNFNWSPLTADADFYSRAQDLLTTALNKSPKPPIIVDDILVNELNLGSVPPELEILEIGDLAEDRFRGIFKMCYSGDAFLTLKTRVQANPLNTYLFSKPSFTSPDPLAASSGLTIPLQITLSEIKLSAFIILVFSRQKGLTLVFRNDPLESLKVSSTFDSIPFVRDYLQKEIEAQLRVLFMDELPAIIHRLSLRLWCPEYRAKEDQEIAEAAEKEQVEIAVDPLASPPQDAVDARGNVLDASEISLLSLDGGSETHSLFSQKSLLGLAALTDSHRTLSLFTPSIRDTVFRAWAQPSDRSDMAGTSTPNTPSLTRSHSSQGSQGTVYTFNENDASISSRPSLVSLQSATTGLSLGSGRHSRTHHNQKKKRRVVNLRKNRTSSDDVMSESGESTTTTTTESTIPASSEPIIPSRIPEEPEEDLITPPRSPSTRIRFSQNISSDETGRVTSLPRRIIPTNPPSAAVITQPAEKEPEQFSRQRPSYQPQSFSPEKSTRREERDTAPAVSFTYAPHQLDTPAGGIVEQAWMMKMAGEIARRVNEGKSEGFWREREADDAPPAYEAAAGVGFERKN